MNLTELPAIPYGTTPKVLLLGNGINKCFGEMKWKELIDKVSEGKNSFSAEQVRLISDLPYPLQPVVLTDDDMDSTMGKVSELLIGKEISIEQRQLMQPIFEIGFDAILTTNYSYDLQMAACPSFTIRLSRANKWRKHAKEGNKTEEVLGLYTYFEMPAETRKNRIWHIHGEAGRPKSIVLGHYSYGTLLAYIQKKSSEVIHKYKDCCKKGKDYQPESWIEYFLLGNVYVLGFGFDFSEMDLWWLACCKKRNFSGCGEMVFYEADWEKEEKFPLIALAKAYGMTVSKIHVDSTEEYKDYYRKVFSDIKMRSSK